MSEQANLTRLLRPKSIAVVGASKDPRRMGAAVVPGLIANGFKGEVYPINKGYEEIAGRKCYPSVEAIPGDVDHCIIAIGREQVPAVLAECRRKNVGGISIWSSGFAELDSGGKDAQEQLRAIADGIPFIGPNCMGFANLADRVFASSASLTLERNSECGDLALISQSGGVAFATICTFAEQRQQRFSYVVNSGNTAGISFGDLLEFMFEDENTRIVSMVIESDMVVAQAVERIRAIGLKKPVVMLKLGRGKTGAQMAQSHTGSLAGDYRVTRDCAEQSGIACADDVDELLDLVELLRCGIKGYHADQLSALSISGGNVTLCADHADAKNLSFAHLSAQTEEALRQILPDYITIHNPIDITGLGVRDEALHANVVRALVKDPNVRTIIPILTTFPSYIPACTMLAAVKAESGCGMIVLWTGGSFESESESILRKANIPIFRYPGRMAAALNSLRRASVPLKADASRLRMSDKLKAPHLEQPCTEADALAFLETFGIPTPKWRRCSKANLAEGVRDVGYPVVIKADVSETHISDEGGVILNVTDDADLARHDKQINLLPSDKLVVSQFLPGTELIVSTFRHPVFGRLLLVGSGGILVELVSDVRFLAVPARPDDIERALLETAGGRLLKSGRRKAMGYEDALAFLHKMNDLAVALGDGPIQVELNPVTVGVHGAAAVDAAVSFAAG